MAQKFLRKYGEAATLDFVLFKPDGVDFKADASFAAGDVTVMRDEGTEGNAANLPTDEGKGYSLVLSATEMEAARIVVYLVDQDATKAWLDDYLVIETYGDANAQHGFDLDAAEPQVNLSKWAGTSVGVGSVSGLPKVDAHAINDGLLDDNNATIKLKNLHIRNSNGHGLECYGQNGSGIYGEGYGEGEAGIKGQGDTDFDSHGIYGLAGQNGHGIYGQAVGNNGSEYGILGEGPAAGIKAKAETGYEGQGLECEGDGSGKDLNLVRGLLGVDAQRIDGSQTAAQRLKDSVLTIIKGAAVSGTLTTSEMTTDLTEATNDHYNDRVIIWITGTLTGQAAQVLDYDGTGKKLTFTPVTEAALEGDEFIIV